jgi:hypothetical protein
MGLNVYDSEIIVILMESRPTRGSNCDAVWFKYYYPRHMKTPAMVKNVYHRHVLRWFFCVRYKQKVILY